MSPTVLICTVGGSHKPILTALQESQPEHALFFCTGTDPATGGPGSLSQIVGKGTPVEVRGKGGVLVEKLPNIPTQAGLSEDRTTVAEVPADDLDEAVAAMLKAIAELRERLPDAAFIADYTGGTKTMTAALVIAALESQGVELQLVTGTRRDLVRVRDGSQGGISVGAEGIRLRRAMAPYVAAWGRYAYGEAADGLARLRRPRDRQLRGELQIALDLSRAFDAWDRFDHAIALELVSDYQARIGRTRGALLTFLKMLAAPDDDPRKAPARLWDLWLNAQRRAGQGRYDDAIARLYRLLEWTAQWLLGQKGIATSDLTPEQIPPDLDIHPNRDGKRQAGLVMAWELVAHQVQGAAAAFVEAERDRMRNLLLVRNASILAHGDRPVQRRDWEAFSDWCSHYLLPLLEREAKGAGLRMRPGQLPDQPIW